MMTIMMTTMVLFAVILREIAVARGTADQNILSYLGFRLESWLLQLAKLLTYCSMLRPTQRPTLSEKG